MNNEFSYYLPFPVIVPSTPTLIVDSNPEPNVDLDMEMPYPLDGIDKIEFRFWEPYPKNPNMADYLVRNGGDGVLSEKLYNILSSLNIEGLQLIPATITDPRSNVVYERYYFPHIYNYIECLDRNESVYTLDVLDMIETIDKMVLDTKILSKIPLESRRIFRLGELYTQELYHESVVEKIMAVNPTGIRFVRVEDYHTGSAFD
jgi:hypothetical protein